MLDAPVDCRAMLRSQRRRPFPIDPCVGTDRIQAGGRELERVRLFGSASRRQTGPLLLAILALSRCAQKLTLLTTKLQ